VTFFEGVEVDQHQQSRTWAETRWKRFFGDVDIATDSEKWNTFSSRRYNGSVRNCTSPAMDFFYLCKLRPTIDWPDIINFEGSIESLAEKAQQSGIVNILEPCYILPVTGTRYVAMMRSSGGPTPRAISDWIDAFCHNVENDSVFELRPVFTQDALRRLQLANGARRLSFRYVSLHDDAIESDDVAGHVNKAVSEVARISDQEMSVEMTLSFGRANIGGLGYGSETLLDEVRRLVDSDAATHGKLSKLQATVINDNEGGLESDPIDFLNERYSESVSIGGSEDDEPSPEVILSGMMDAIGTFRRKIGRR
jgi:hypothetical protein